jgi:thioredoxin reductase
MYDVVIVGGGIAGMSAALILGRARRSVLVLDGGPPRNLPAAHSQGFVTHDGAPPLELLAKARDDLRAYENVEVLALEATSAAGASGAFELVLSDGRQIETRRIVLATGMRDLLPPIEGLAELWGKGVFHCPYCHGWEVRDRTWALLGAGPLSFDRVAMFRGWAGELALLTNGSEDLEPEQRRRILALGARVDDRVIRSVHALGDETLSITFEDGDVMTVGAVFAAPGQAQRSHLAESLSCEFIEMPVMDARFVKTDDVTGETTVPGVYAAGDMTGPGQSLVLAAASGAKAAYRLNHAMAMEDAERLLATAGSV